MPFFRCLIIAAVIAASLLAGRGRAETLDRVTIEFLTKEKKEAFARGPGFWAERYRVMANGELWLTRRAKIMTDESLGLALAFDPSEPRTRYVYLFIDEPEKTTFEQLVKVLDRLRGIIEKNVTGQGRVVIEVLLP